MSTFPRTEVGGLSVSRMIVGTNWFLGYTHSTPGQSRVFYRAKIAPGEMTGGFSFWSVGANLGTPFGSISGS